MTVNNIIKVNTQKEITIDAHISNPTIYINCALNSDKTFKTYFL